MISNNSKDFVWYEKIKPFKYGDYDKDKKLYYNEDTNRWVSRLTKKNIPQRYIRYEFSVFDDRKIEAEFGYELTERVGKFLFLLYKKGLEVERINSNRWVYVDSSKVVCGILTKSYNQIIEKLTSIKVKGEALIELDFRKGNFGKKTKLYKLNDAFFKEDCHRRRLYLRHTMLIRFLDSYYNKGGENRDKFVNWEVESIKNIDVFADSSLGGVRRLIEKRLNRIREETYYKKDWDFLSLKERNKLNLDWGLDNSKALMHKSIVSFELMKLDIDTIKNGGFNYGICSFDKFSNRYYNPINNKEKEFRQTLRLDGEKVVNIDMINGYVSLLYTVLKGIKLGVNGSFWKKIGDVLDGIDFNDFLTKYEVCFEGDVAKRKDFYSIVYDELFAEISVEDMVSVSLNRMYMKKLIQKLINGEDKDGRRKRYINNSLSYDEIMEKVFCVGGFKVLEKLKSVDLNFKKGKPLYGYYRYKNVSKIMMSLEVMAMQMVWEEMIRRKIYYVSLFDGMLIKKSELEDVNNIIEKTLKGVYSSIRFKSKVI